jgi:hypothetical protein
MGWKNLSYWLRGGVIGLVVGLVVNIITSILENIYSLNIVQTIPSKPYIVDLLIGFINIPNSIIFAIMFYIFYIIELAFYWFIIGALAGWLVGKIKSKKIEGK